MRRNPELQAILDRAGISLPGAMDFMPRVETKLPDGTVKWGEIVYDGAFGEAARAAEMAWDAEPGLITTPNAGIPALFTTWVDPNMIDILVQPNNATKIYGETRKGDWLDETFLFPIVERTGEVSGYSDYSENGRSGANVQWENRQAYLFQTFIEAGDREIERMGRGRIDWMARLNSAAALNLDKFMNASYFYGIANLQLFGMLNDPSLSAALTPVTKAAGGTGWQFATPNEIFQDLQSMWVELQTQTGSNLEMDAPLVLALHSISESYLMNLNSFGNQALAFIKKTFPNLRVQQAPQFLSGTTYSAQLFVESIEGQQTGQVAFNEKMRAHRVIFNSSSFKQKKSAGTVGGIWFQPMGVASIAGI